MRANRWVLGIMVVALLLLLAARCLMDRPAQPPPAPQVLPESRPQHQAAVATKLTEPVPVQEPVAASDVATNAANIYRQAFAAFDALTADEKKALADWKSEVDPFVAAALCNKLRPITDLLHQASTVTNCDWGLKSPIAFDTPLPHLAQARSLARATVWSAAHCRGNDGTGAADDLVATLRLGRNISQFLIGHLVQTAIEQMVLGQIAAAAGALRGAPAERLLQVLADPQYEESFYRALESEADGVGRMADKVASMSPEETQEYLRAMLGSGDKTAATDLANTVAGLRLAADWERDYARALQLPAAEYQAWAEQWRAIQEENPVVRLVAPALDKILDKTRSAVVQRALVLAGLAVIQDGPGAAAKYPDPATGQAFAYRETATGFELQSGYQYREKPVTMSFQTR